MIRKKEIDFEKSKQVMEALMNEIPGPSEITISARQCIIMNFDKFDKCVQSGRSLKSLHHFLLLNGIDIGTYESFNTVFKRIKRARRRREESLELEKSMIPRGSVPSMLPSPFE
jgi:hypothetical protein